MSIVLILLLVTACSADQLHRINNVKKHVATESIPEYCIRCIFNVYSGCAQKGYRKDYCGLFVISKDYWINAGELAMDGEQIDSNREYENCVNNVDCVKRTIQSYLLKYKQDCNGDDVIDYHDYIRIHLLGGKSNMCRGIVPQFLWQSYTNCLNQNDEHQINFELHQSNAILSLRKRREIQYHFNINELTNLPELDEIGEVERIPELSTIPALPKNYRRGRLSTF